MWYRCCGIAEILTAVVMYGSKDATSDSTQDRWRRRQLMYVFVCKKATLQTLALYLVPAATVQQVQSLLRWTSIVAPSGGISHARQCSNDGVFIFDMA